MAGARRRARALAFVALASLWVDNASAQPDSPALPARTPEALLADGRLAYERGDYPGAVRILIPLLYPSITLATEDAVIDAHRLLVLSYLLQKKDNEAEEEVRSILALRPSFQLDPILDPPTAVTFLDSVRKRQDTRVRELHARERAEKLAHDQEEERKRRAAADRIFVQRDVKRNSRLVATIPFGVGQWQNGQPRKAALFLSGELVFGALSLASYLALQQKYPVDPNTNHRTFPANDNDEKTALALTGVQLGAGIAFWATLLWGIVDAHVLFKREIIVRDRELPQSPLKSLRISPSVGPNQAGLAVQGAF